MKIEIRTECFDPWEEVRCYQEQGAMRPGSFGACTVFVGTMRDFNEGEPVSEMVLEHYQGMTEKQLIKLAEQAQSSYALLDLLLLHRVGEIRPNMPIVLIAVWSAHRAAALEACRELIETLKTRATFWKKETLSGRQRWVARNTPGH